MDRNFTNWKLIFNLAHSLILRSVLVNTDFIDFCLCVRYCYYTEETSIFRSHGVTSNIKVYRRAAAWLGRFSNIWLGHFNSTQAGKWWMLPGLYNPQGCSVRHQVSDSGSFLVGGCQARIRKIWPLTIVSKVFGEYHAPWMLKTSFVVFK